MPASWLLKTEPSTYSWQDLVRDKTTTWDGVANAAALINLRAMKTGDEALIYHSGDEKAIVGIARITRGGYADPKLDDPRRAVVDVAWVKALAKPVTLATIKADKRLASFALVRISRLSCMPVSAEHRAVLKELGVR
ncbi:MAG TPA: EVE domain-containing protein [Gemmatimonadales bacterium]|jgi:predicted RNA-binding protein with PUA-like domain|nr:EVE domain-containing protein [Gemmatimonadales bacterium]